MKMVENRIFQGFRLGIRVPVSISDAWTIPQTRAQLEILLRGRLWPGPHPIYTFFDDMGRISGQNDIALAVFLCYDCSSSDYRIISY
jgi:hypothetical protein